MDDINTRYLRTKEARRKGFKKILWILWIGLLLIFVLWVENEIKSQLNDKGLIRFNKENYRICLEESEFKYGLIDYSDNKDSLLQKIGIPDTIEVNEDLHSEIWQYGFMDIGLSNNHIYYMWCKDSSLMTPSGIKIGLSKNDISKILFGSHYPEHTLDPDDKNIQIVNCRTEYFLVMDFRNNILINLEMGIDLP
jgi:hypothetical protein